MSKHRRKGGKARREEGGRDNGKEGRREEGGQSLLRSDLRASS